MRRGKAEDCPSPCDIRRRKKMAGTARERANHTTEGKRKETFAESILGVRKPEILSGGKTNSPG